MYIDIDIDINTTHVYYQDLLEFTSYVQAKKYKKQ